MHRVHGAQDTWKGADWRNLWNSWNAVSGHGDSGMRSHSAGWWKARNADVRDDDSGNASWSNAGMCGFNDIPQLYNFAIKMHDAGIRDHKGISRVCKYALGMRDPGTCEHSKSPYYDDHNISARNADRGNAGSECVDAEHSS